MSICTSSRMEIRHSPAVVPWRRRRLPMRPEHRDDSPEPSSAEAQTNREREAAEADSPEARSPPSVGIRNWNEETDRQSFVPNT